MKKFQSLCNVCSKAFDSRTKLFNHIKEEHHARVDSNDGDHAGRKKGKRGGTTKVIGLQ